MNQTLYEFVCIIAAFNLVAALIGWSTYMRKWQILSWGMIALGGAWLALQLPGELAGRLVHGAGIISVLGMYSVFAFWKIKHNRILNR